MTNEMYPRTLLKNKVQKIWYNKKKKKERDAEGRLNFHFYPRKNENFKLGNFEC